MSYVVALVDCSDSLSQADRDGVQTLLTQWFTRAAGTRPPNGSIGQVSVSWTTAPTAAADLVLYFVRDYTQSTIRHMRQFRAPPDWANAGGLTALQNYGSGIAPPNSLHASEVYLDKWHSAADLAMAAFHEAFHNQLRVDSSMHGDANSYGGGIAVEFPPSGTVPTDANLRRIGGVMDMRNPQWLDGYARSHPRRPRTARP
jgi:hypothetical protein